MNINKRIEEINNELFLLDMVDLQTYKQKRRIEELETELKALCPLPMQEPIKREPLKIGDLRTDDCGTWKVIEIDNNGSILWEQI